MALTAGELQIFIDVNTQEIEKLKKELGKVSGETKKSQTSFLKLAGAFGLATSGVDLLKAGLRKAAGGLKFAVNSARDLEESNNKLKVTFSGLQSEAFKTRDALVKSYGLSSKEATSLLGATGDLLTGFGFTQDKALELSTSVQQLSVDLASFQNLEGGAERASEALTKALLGETESAKSLGIVIRQNTKEFKAQVKATAEQQGVTEDVAKAQLIFQQAVTQSKNAMGDFARTSDSLANRQRRLQAVQAGIASTIGSALTPALTKVTGELLKSAEGFQDWLKEGNRLKILENVVNGLAFGFIVLVKTIGLAVKATADFIAFNVNAAKSIIALGKAIVNPFKDSRKEIEETNAAANESLGNLVGNFKDFGSEVKESFKEIFSGTDLPAAAENAGEETGKAFSKGLSKEFKEGFSETTKIVSTVFSGLASVTQDALGVIGEAFTQFNEERLARLTEQHEMEIEAIDERLAREIELIENNGVTKEQALQTELETLQQKLAMETDAEKKADLAEQISEIQKEVNIKKAEDRALLAKDKANKDFAKKKHKQEVELFNAKKAIDIANIAMSIATGIVAAWASAAGWPGPSMIAGLALAGVLTGIIAGVGAAQIGIIASKQPPPAPRFERGTNFTPGGLSLVGEQGAELVNLPTGGQVFPADVTSDALRPMITLNATVLLDSVEVPIKEVLINTRENEALRGA